MRAALSLPAKKAALALEPVAQRAPKDPVVQFNYGVVLFCAGYLDEASTAFQAAKSGGRDTFYEMRADQILHPQYFHAQGRPLSRSSSRAGSDPLLLRGLIQQRSGHQHSAERALRAGRAASGRTTTRRRWRPRSGASTRTTSRPRSHGSGPLVKRFPQSQTVRYHLGLLLAWTGQRGRGRAPVPARTLARAPHDARAAGRNLPERACDNWD